MSELAVGSLALGFDPRVLALGDLSAGTPTRGWRPEEGATLDVDLLNWRMWDSENGARAPNALTVSRPSARSRVGPSGLIETVGSGLIARDFTPAGAARGLLIEPQTTNLATYSEDFSNAVWLKVATTISANAAVAPDGATTGDKLVESAATTVHFQYRMFTVTAGALSTYTIFAKAAERGFLQIILDNGSSIGAYATWNLATGAVTQSAQLSTATGLVAPAAEDVGNGWWRLRITTTAGAAATSVRAALVLTNTGTGGFAPSYAGDGTSGVYIWGAQFEASGVPTSYAPAGASSAVRYADGVSLPFGSWGVQGQGGLYVEATLIDTGLNQPIAILTNAALDGYLVLYRATTGAVTLAIVNGGVNQGTLNLGTHAGSGVLKIAAGWAANDFAAKMSGGSLVTDASGTVPVDLATLRLGGQWFSAYLNGHLRRVSAFPTRAIMSNTKIAELVA